MPSVMLVTMIVDPSACLPTGLSAALPVDLPLALPGDPCAALPADPCAAPRPSAERAVGV